MRKLRPREVKSLVSGGSGVQPRSLASPHSGRCEAACILDTCIEETSTPNPSSFPEVFYPLRRKRCSCTGESSQTFYRNIVEKAALNLLEVVDHAIHLQSPRPGTWQEGCSAGLDLERRFMNLEGSFSEGGREATRTARTTMLRQKSTDHVSQYCPHEKVFSNAPMLFWDITCVCVCVCVLVTQLYPTLRSHRF